MDFVVPDTFAAGPQVWNVVNDGLQVHHIVLSHVPAGTTEQQILDLVTLFFAPPDATSAVSPAGEPGLAPEELVGVFYMLPLSSGRYNLYELDLAPGTYAMLCFMRDLSGTPHVTPGMVEIIVVE